MTIRELLAKAWDLKASDVHLSPGKPPLRRLNGDIAEFDDEKSLAHVDIRAMLREIMTDEQDAEYEEQKEIDYCLELPQARYRVNAFHNIDGSCAVFRTIPTKILTLDDLGMPDVLKRLTTLERGLVLVTGPTGSGKSTTLAAMIDLVNSSRPAHILTIEDPVEFVHAPKMGLIHHREVGTHTETFASALRASLREDPNVILVGEMRDLETIQLALTAAETGALVFATLHTSSAAKTINRIIDVFPTNQQEQVRTMFADSIQAVISQVLLKRVDKPGRVAAIEVMLGTNAIRNQIRSNKIAQIATTIEMGRELGMQSTDQALLDHLRAGRISLEGARERASDKSKFPDSLMKNGAVVESPSPAS